MRADLSMRRIGLLGGAFNPPHRGHLRLAELALAHLDLDQLRFMPTACSPHKANDPGDNPAARLRLLLAALEGFPGPVGIERLELDRGGTSYTSDTLETLHGREPENQWILVIGSDQLPGLPAWNRAPRVLELASVAVAPRPSAPAEIPAELAGRVRGTWSGAPGEIVWLPGTAMEAASSRIRDERDHVAVATSPRAHSSNASGSVSRLRSSRSSVGIASVTENVRLSPEKTPYLM